MVDPFSYFSFQPVLHNWYNKSHGMCYPICGVVHIKDSLTLIRKRSHEVTTVSFLYHFICGP